MGGMSELGTEMDIMESYNPITHEWLTLPSMVASQLLDDTLIARPVPTTMPAIYQHLYWHQSTDKDDALIWLRGQIQHIFKR